MRQVILGIILLGSTSLGHAYDWQKHIPDEAKQYIPGAKEGQLSSGNSVGPLSLKGKVKLTNHMGPLVLTDAEVTTAINVFGPLTADKTNFLDMISAHGPVTLTGSASKYNHVKGNVEIFGPLTAEWMTFDQSVAVFGPITGVHCTFRAPIEIHTSKISLKDCTLTDLKINDNKDKPVEIELDNVQISGHLTVTSGLGTLTTKNMTIDAHKLTGIPHISAQ